MSLQMTPELATKILEADAELTEKGYDPWLRPTLVAEINKLILEALKPSIISQARLVLKKGNIK